jgi:hypothetical protein
MAAAITALPSMQAEHVIAARGARLSISATYRDCHGARLWTDQSRRVSISAEAAAWATRFIAEPCGIAATTVVTPLAESRLLRGADAP